MKVNHQSADARDLVIAVSAALPNIMGGSLAVFGDFFGRPFDNFHMAVGAFENEDGSATVEFDQGETLQVWQPSGIEVSANRFRILRARKVRWEWFYYGRPQIPENRFFIEHEVRGMTVNVLDNVSWAQHIYKPTFERPAVEFM